MAQAGADARHYGANASEKRRNAAMKPERDTIEPRLKFCVVAPARGQEQIVEQEDHANGDDAGEEDVAQEVSAKTNP